MMTREILLVFFLARAVMSGFTGAYAKSTEKGFGGLLLALAAIGGRTRAYAKSIEKEQ